MTTMTHHTSPIVIPALDRYVSQTVGPEVQVGTTVSTNDGGTAVYCGPTMSAVAAYNMVVLPEDFRPSNATTTNVADGAGGLGKQVGWAQYSIAVSCYGWNSPDRAACWQSLWNQHPYAGLRMTGW